MSSPLPPIEVLLGPAGSGKSAACLDRLLKAKGGALLLVPNHEYAERMRARLSAIDPDADDEAILPLAEAARALAKTVHARPEPIRRAQQWLILSDLFEQTIGEDAFFHRMREAPGFIPALAESIRELKLSGVPPADLSQAAAVDATPEDAWVLADPSFRRKAGEMSRLYDSYQRFLNENGLLDEEEVYRLAIEAAPTIKEGRLAPDLVLVDGFYRLSRLWRELLAAMAHRGARIVITLPADQRRSLLFATPLRTLESLEEEFEVQARWLDSPDPSGPHALQVLERNLFDPNCRVSAGLKPPDSEPVSEPNSAAAPPPVLLFDAPNPYTEVEMAARALLRERIDRRIPWSDCAIIVRSIGDYAALLGGVFSRYGVPHAFHRGRPLTENAAVRTLSTLFRIYLGGWQREDVISFLKSDRVSSRGVGFDFARVLARSRGARQGRAAWDALLLALHEKNEEVAEALRRLLELEVAFPVRADTYDRLAAAVRQAVDVFSLDQPEGRSEAAREDRMAMKLALEAVAQMVSHARLAEAEPITFSQFNRRLVGLWRSLTYMPVEPRDAVSIIEPYDAPQLRPKFVIVLGLTERVFPRRIKDDPFFRDDERDALRVHTPIRLEPQRARSDDERLLFYMAVTAPTERLILSFPRASEESDTLQSFFLDEVRSALEAGGERLPAVVRMLSDVAPAWDECVTDRDRILSACASAGEAPDLGGMETRVDISEILETRRRPPTPALGPDALAAFSAPHRYSVTEIETYNRCPFQHFLKYGLKLRAEADGAGPLDRGALHHDTLRRALRAVAATGVKADRQQLREVLLEQMVACLNDRAIDARPHRRTLMQMAVEAALEVCAEREERYSDLFGLTPAHFELAFGMEDFEEELEDGRSRRRDYDPASTLTPLEITAEDGTPIHLCGAIDRVDIALDGRTAMVLDYKMGSTDDWAKIREGQSIQIPLYLLAVEQVWGMVGAVGCYDSPRDSGRRRFFRKELVDTSAFQPVPGVEDGRLAKPVGADEFQQAVEAAKAAVRTAVAGIRAGRILPTPGDHCRFCDFVDVCRTAPDGTHDGEEQPEQSAEEPQQAGFENSND